MWSRQITKKMREEFNIIPIEEVLKKAPPLLIERMNLFINILFKNSWENDDYYNPSKESHTQYLARIEGNSTKPDRIKVEERLKQRQGFSLDYDEADIIEIALFKAAIKEDREIFMDCLSSPELNIEVQAIILSFCMQMACYCRDIDVVRFLAKNTNNIADIVTVEDTKHIESISALNYVFGDLCNPTHIDRELIQILLDNGLDLNKKRNGSTEYFKALDSLPEELAIEFLAQITDINETQHTIVYYLREEDREESAIFEPRHYLLKAIYLGKYELANAIVDKMDSIGIFENNQFDINNYTHSYVMPKDKIPPELLKKLNELISQEEENPDLNLLTHLFDTTITSLCGEFPQTSDQAEESL